MAIGDITPFDTGSVQAHPEHLPHPESVQESDVGWVEARNPAY